MGSDLKIALISGGMYDRLYARIPQFEQATGVAVAVEFAGTHPELNAQLAGLDPVPYDLVSTHTKYAPSQQRFLAPLEGFDTGDFFPSLLHMAEMGGALYGIPRNIDLRLLHYRTDLIETPPASWDELVELARRTTRAPQPYGFVFTGMESGLFGTFFELAESAGARIFPPSLVAEVNNEGGRWALGVLRELYASGAVPAAVARWHYDEVHQFFRTGNAAMVCDWPGYYGSYQSASSAVRHRFRLARMPAGPTGRVCCYAGSHTFALTRSGVDKEPARELLRFLTAPEQQTLEAQHGSVPVRRQVMEEQRQAAQGDQADRMALLASAIEHDLIIPPKLPYYPHIEDILWRNVRSAMMGETAIADALVEIERRIGECVTHAA
jgi:multiple sugar transport system substrate-binding protein